MNCFFEKKIKNFIRKISKVFSFVLVIVLVSLFYETYAFANGSIDTSKKGTLCLKYQYDTESLANVTVKIYQIAKIKENASFVLLPPYNDKNLFPITDINSITRNEEWDLVKTPIESYIYTNKVAETKSNVSDISGEALFSDLELGIYLVVTSPLKLDDCTYTFSSFFVSIPQNVNDTQNIDANFISYNVVGVPKCEKIIHPKKKEYLLMKRWMDLGNENKRPRKIEVELYLNGEKYDTVTLDSSNGWSYHWESDEGSKWSVAEKVPENYTVMVDSNKETFIITNTYPDSPQKPGKPDKPQNPEQPNEPDKPRTPVEEVLGVSRRVITGDDTPEVLGRRRLPQTGQEWMPVFVLAIIGMLLFVYGFHSERNKDI